MKEQRPTLADLVAKVKQHPSIDQAGMILCHNGIVRNCNRAGDRTVQTLSVKSDPQAVDNVKQWAMSQPGILTVEIQAFDGTFQVGEDLLYIVVAGDIREHVFDVMRETLERIKTTGVQKSEFYCD